MQSVNNPCLSVAPFIFNSGNDHCAGALVRKDLGKEGVAFRAADDVGAVNTAFQ